MASGHGGARPGVPEGDQVPCKEGDSPLQHPSLLAGHGQLSGLSKEVKVLGFLCEITQFSKHTKGLPHRGPSVARHCVCPLLADRGWMLRPQMSASVEEVTTLERGAMLTINFSPALREIINEAKYLEQLGFSVPELARNVALQEDKFLR